MGAPSYTLEIKVATFVTYFVYSLLEKQGPEWSSREEFIEYLR